MSPAAPAEAPAARARAGGAEPLQVAQNHVIRLDWLLQCSAEKAYVRLRPRHYLARDPAAIAADPRVDCYGDECGPPPAWQSVHGGDGVGGRALL